MTSARSAFTHVYEDLHVTNHQALDEGLANAPTPANNQLKPHINLRHGHSKSSNLSFHKIMFFLI